VGGGNDHFAIPPYLEMLIVEVFKAFKTKYNAYNAFNNILFDKNIISLKLMNKVL